MILRKLQIEPETGQSQGYLEALSQIDANGTFMSKLIHSQKNQAFDLILTKDVIEKISNAEQLTGGDDEEYSKICYDHSKFEENLVNTFLSSENSKKSESVIKKSWFSLFISNDDKETKIDKLIWKKISKLDQSGIVMDRVHVIPGFWLFGFWPKIVQKRQKTEMADFGATRSGFHKNSQIFIILLLVLAFLSNFWQNHIW